MKKCFYLLLLLITAACGSKNNDVTPDTASKVAGTYEVSSLQQSSSGGATLTYALPLSVTTTTGVMTLSAQVIATRKTESTVGLVYVTKTTGQPDSPTDFGTADIKGTELYIGSTKLGTADGSVLTLESTDTKGTRTVISGKKK